MDTSGYEIFSFGDSCAFNIADGAESRSFPSHRHSYGEIIVVGEEEPNIYRIDEGLYKLKKGDIILVWPMELHEIVDADRKGSLIIQYSNSMSDSLFELKRIKSRFHDLHILCVGTHAKLVSKLTKIALSMKKTMEDGRKDREIRCAGLFLEFMLVLDRHYDELLPDISDDGIKTISDNTLCNIISVTDYIKNNITAEDLSQAKMAERAGISKDYFSRVFSEVTGCNYSKWLNTIRVEKAVSLFPEQSLTLTEIAMLAGFKSIPSFNRVFRDEKGISPSEYRRILKDGTNSKGVKSEQ